MAIGVSTGKKDNSKRRYPGTGGRRHNPVNIATKRTEAQERQEVYDKLTIEQRIELLDRRLGKGIGAARQRERLARQLQERDRVPTTAMGQAVARSRKAKDRRADERANRPGKANATGEG